jgi:hypothetical protein
MEEGSGDKVGTEVPNRVSLSVERWKPRFARVVVK